MINPNKYLINKNFILAIIICLGAFLFYSLLQFFTAFLGAVIFYVLSKPLVSWLLKNRWPKGLIASLIIVISFFIILLPITLMVSLLLNKISNIQTNPDMIMGLLKNIDQQIYQKYNIELLSDKTLSSLQDVATSAVSAIVNQSFGLLATIAMMYFFLYFMITNVNRLEAAAVLYLPFHRDKIYLFGNELVAQTFGNAVGIPVIAIAQGVCGYIGYLIGGVTDAAFWGVITGFASVIPIVGTGLAYIPITISLFVSGHTGNAVFVGLWSLIILGSIDNLIRFLLAKKMANVHPVVTVLGVIMGVSYFGFTGLVFGPIVISYFLLLLKIYYWENMHYAKANRKTRKKKISFGVENFSSHKKK
jgi:predicted PurR-regulated permease PerM